MSEAATGDNSPPFEFQYASAEHERETALAGIWLFLVSEALFFGPLFLSWIFCRHWNTAGFDYGSRQSNIVLGTFNTALLLTGGLLYNLGLDSLTRGGRRVFVLGCCATFLSGVIFIIVKFGLEWREDLEKGFFPGGGFSVEGPFSSGARLFFTFYFLGTAIHGLHMFVGLALMAWLISRARDLTPQRHVEAEVVGLYWSFVDLVWVFLYPSIYLVGRAG
jgi:cytochrome c oxidase subunit III